MQINNLQTYNNKYIHSPKQCNSFSNKTMSFGATSKSDSYEKNLCVAKSPVIQGAKAMNIKKELTRILGMFNVESLGDPAKDLDKLYEIANTDGLTGLKNKRALIDDIQKHAEEMKAQGKTLTIAMFDMDNFKGVNDLLGYDIGDLFIKTIGAEVSKVAEKNGIDAYRFGGEEFIVLMPDTDNKTSIKIANEIKDNLNCNEFLDSYMWKYIFEGKTRIAKLEEDQAPFKAFKHSLDKYNIIQEYLKEYNNVKEQDPRITKFINEKLQETETQVRVNFASLAIKAVSHAKTKAEQSFLATATNNAFKADDVTKLCSKGVMNYFNVNCNNEAKIAQITQWIENLQTIVDDKPQGFTITGGIKKFHNLNKSPEDFIKETGDVLSNGKRHHKGNVYIEG